MLFKYHYSIATMLAAGSIFYSTSVSSREEVFIETVDGWEINKTLGKNDPLPCQMTHSYRDMTDGGSQNTIGITRSGGELIFMLSYEGWNWYEGEIIKSELIIADVSINPIPTWIGKEAILYCRIIDQEVRKMTHSPTILVRFPEGDADFDVSGIERAFSAMDRCNQASSKD